MHRIDSATARANANGQGKDGFHDNGDLPNQDATYFTPAWANAVQEEISNVIEALGVSLDKADNTQLLTALVAQFGEKAVLDSTIATMIDRFNQQTARIDALENRTYEDTAIGELFWTVEHFVTASEVSIYKGYGTWERALEGRVPVGFSDIPDDPVEYRTHGAEFGSFEHQLTIDEMPKHKPSIKLSYEGSEVRDAHLDGKGFVALDNTGPFGVHSSDEDDHSSSQSGGDGSPLGAVGNDQPHPNQPPSKTLDCWKRIA